MMRVRNFSHLLLPCSDYQEILGSWVLMNPSRTLPSNCHVGGYENSKHYQGPVYIGRAQIDEELAIGKVIDSWKSGYCEFWFTMQLNCLNKILFASSFKFLRMGTNIGRTVMKSCAVVKFIGFRCERTMKISSLVAKQETENLSTFAVEFTMNN